MSASFLASAAARACALGLLLAPAGAPAQQPAVAGLDHFPLAVRDLDRAAADFAALGFTIKPGRPHGNGIRNAHLKFADGTYVELITAPEAVDLLTRRYVAFLEQGEGPAFHSLHTHDLDAAGAALAALGAPAVDDGMLSYNEDSPLYGLFLLQRGAPSPTDRPEHFIHANTASGVGRIWLAGAEEEFAVLAGLGLRAGAAASCHPFGAPAPQLVTADGNAIALLPDRAQVTSGRRFAAITIDVDDLGAARRALTDAGAPLQEIAGCPGSIWLPPDAAHGGWLEFREAP